MKRLRGIVSWLLAFGLIISAMGNFNIHANDDQTGLQNETTEQKEVTEQTSTTDTKAVVDADVPQTTDEQESQMKGEQIQPFAFPNTEGDFTLVAQKEQVEAGNDASFQIYLGVTGSQTVLENGKLVLTISPEAIFNQDLAELRIFNVQPIYDGAAHTLTYNFPTLQGGLFTNVSLRLGSENGIAFDGVSFGVDGVFSADGIESVSQSASTQIISTGKLSLTNKFKSVVEDSSALAPTQGQTGEWEFGFSVPKLLSGTKYLQEGSKIVVSYSIDSYGTFVGVGEGTPQPTNVNGNVLTWEFDAPTLEEQKNMVDNLFDKTFSLQIKYAMDTPQLHSAVNTLTGSVTFHDGTLGQESLDATISIALSPEGNNPGTSGNTWPIASYGPSDSIGNIYYKNGDAGLKVYDDAVLAFGLMYAPTYADNYTTPLSKYEIMYDIDDHLYINSFYSGDAYYRPNVPFTEEHPGWQPISENPIYDIYVKFGTKDNQDADYTLTKSGVQPGQKLTPEDFGQTDGKHVSQVKFVFTNRPAGMYGNLLNFYMHVEKGYTGRVENKIAGASVSGVSSKNQQVAYGDGTTPWPDVYWERYFTERGVEVIPMPEGEVRVARTSVSLNDTDGNIAFEGSNQVNVSIGNDKASIAGFYGPFESYVLLPSGVTYDSEQPSQKYSESVLLDENYLGTNQQLVKVTWDKEALAGTNYALLPSYSLKTSFAVTIGEDTPSDMSFKVFSPVYDVDFTVPEIVGTPSITDSYRELDVNDINQNGDASEYLVTSGNRYVIHRNSNFIVKKSVKGDQDKTYSALAHATAGTDVSYQFSILSTSDEKLSNLVLMDILPDIGDTDLTSLSQRGSNFTMTLSGPIQVPADWADKVDIVYSTSKSPKRVGVLDKYTVYPDGANVLQDPADAEDAVWLSADEVTDYSAIRSYKIELKENVDWVKGSDLNLTFDMKTPNLEDIDEKLLDSSLLDSERASYNSIAFSANGSMALEPARVGVVLNREIQPVSVSYVDTSNNELLPTETNTGLLNEAFSFQAKDIPGYKVVDVKYVVGDEPKLTTDINSVQGVYGETAQSIQFIYEAVPNDNIDTGVENTSNNTLYIVLAAVSVVALIGLSVLSIRKKRKK